MAFIERQTREEVVVDDFTLEAGETVLFSPWFVQRHPDQWKNPMQFDPDRFQSVLLSGNGSYFPFGLGPRTCPGMNVVNQQLTFALSAILSTHQIGITADTRPGDLGALFRINLEPRGPAKLAATPW